VNRARHPVWRLLLKRQFLICIFLGFTSGLPLYVLLNLVQAWLRSEHVDLTTIGLLALTQFPYTWKFVWAPVMDRYSLPWLGRRRGWMFITQLAVMAAIAALGLADPRRQLGLVAALAGILAFASASADIVIDAFRREILSDDEQGMGNAIHVNAFKLAGLVPGSISLILSDVIPWPAVFAVTAAFMLPGIVMTLLVREPLVRGAPPASLQQAVVAPFREFIARGGWRPALLMLSFIFFYKLGDSLTTALATSFYIDLGFSRTEIGLIAKNVGLWASVAGGLIGGAWLMVLGINRGLWVFGVLQVLSILGFAWLATAGANPYLLSVVIGFEAFASAGLGTAALISFIARATDVRYTATQFALFTSLALVPRTFVNSAAGPIVEFLGWPHYFVLCALLAVPGLLLLPWVAPWRERALVVERPHVSPPP
jgi:PAT family beta-lactamase induction signal transducer AmpG